MMNGLIAMIATMLIFAPTIIGALIAVIIVFAPIVGLMLID